MQGKFCGSELFLFKYYKCIASCIKCEREADMGKGANLGTKFADIYDKYVDISYRVKGYVELMNLILKPMPHL